MQNQYQRRISHQMPMYQSGLMNPVTISNKRLENINCILEPVGNTGGLYLGDIITTLKPELLRDKKITAVLSCMAQKVSLSVMVSSHKIFPIQDTLEFPISRFFSQSTEWIEGRRKEGHNVLVHCHAGVSRSATIVIAYLMTSRKWSAIQTLEFVRSKRQRAKPNANFWQQLLQFQQKLGVTGNPRKGQIQNRNTESKQNIQYESRRSELVAPYQREQIRRSSQIVNIPSTPQQYKIVQHQPKTQLRKRKRIFELPQSDQHDYRKNNVVSSEPANHFAESRRSVYSIINPNGNETPPPQFRENHSAIDFKQMSHEPVKVMPVNHPIQFSSRKSQYLNPSPLVSPFDLHNQYRQQ